MTLRISSKDTRRILDAVARLQGCDEADELPGVMRAAIGSLVSGEIVAYSEFDLANLVQTAPADRDLDAAARLARVSPFVVTDDPHTEREISEVVPWMVRFAEQHPLFRVALREPDPPVAKISDFLTLPQFNSLGLYRQFFQPLSVNRQIAVCPTHCSGLVTGLTVNRSGRDFAERDRRCLTLLAPHLREAFRSTLKRRQLREQLEKQQQVLNRLPTAVVGLTPDGCRIQFETAAARRLLLACFPGREGRSRGLPDRLRTWIEDALRRCTTLDDPQAINAHLRLSTPAGELHARHVRAEGDIYLLLQLDTRADAIQTLARLGLTHREAEVLECMRDGSTNRQIARRLRISPGTVRTHVERILSKLGEPTRTGAVRRAEVFLQQTGGG